MNVLTAARAQMEVSLAFHMIFAALGIGMPLLMLLAEYRWLRHREPAARDLARQWGKATALLFAVGAVSGTALSFELGLLWPRFMRIAGPSIGPAFALEGFAFFIEAIFVGLYLYGWDRLSPRAHFLCGVPVAVSGMLSGVIVLAANAWMQHPVGFDLVNGRPTHIVPGAVFANPYWYSLALHSTLACYVSTGFAVAGVYAVSTLRGRDDGYARTGLRLALSMGCIAAVAQVVSGDLSARNAAEHQPAKLAAMESHFETARGASLTIGGIPDPAHHTVHFALRIPHGLSFLATHDANATVRGLDSFPPDQRPNVFVCHVAFQLMVACGFAMLAVGVAYAWLRRRRTLPRWFLLAVSVASPMGFLALEAGWTVTEVGRQPWVIYGVLRTRDAVTPSVHTPVAFVGFSLVYLVLGATLVVLLRGLSPPRSTGAT